MEYNYKVYKHTNMVNGKVYIGITMNELNVRFGKNGSNYKECPYFWSAIQKYGWDAFSHELLMDGLTKEEAGLKEIELIEQYDSRNPMKGYNLARGGYSQPGEENPFFGKHHSEKTKRAVAESNKRRVWTDEARRKVKEKNSGANSVAAKQVVCVETGIIYPSLTDAANVADIRPTHVCDVLKGRRNHYRHMHWKYYHPEKPNDYPLGEQVQANRNGSNPDMGCDIV